MKLINILAIALLLVSTQVYAQTYVLVEAFSRADVRLTLAISQFEATGDYPRETVYKATTKCKSFIDELPGADKEYICIVRKIYEI